MPYPIITPQFFSELTDKENKANEGVIYQVLTTPSAIEYVFPIYQERVLRKLMEISAPMQYKMVNLKPEHEAEYAQKGAELVKATPVLKDYWSLKTVTMNILQDREYTLEQRMLILNYSYKIVQNMLDQGKDEIIPKFVSDITRTPKHDEIMKYFETIKPNYAYSLCDALSFIRSMPKTDAMDEVRKKLFENIGISEDMKDFRFDENKYLPVRKAYYEEFMKDREHYMEQVMVNYVWTYCLPYADYNIKLWDNFIFFNTLFNSIKVGLMCYLYGSKDYDNDFVKFITAFDESIRKTPGNIVRRVVDANAKEGLCNNGDMAILAIS